jgi:THO complex subunit 4
LRRAFLHIGPNGKSAGVADVVFVNSNDAERARVTYNNVQLDGKGAHKKNLYIFINSYT